MSSHTIRVHTPYVRASFKSKPKSSENVRITYDTFTEIDDEDDDDGTHHPSSICIDVKDIHTYSMHEEIDSHQRHTHTKNTSRELVATMS